MSLCLSTTIQFWSYVASIWTWEHLWSSTCGSILSMSWKTFSLSMPHPLLGVSSPSGGGCGNSSPTINPWPTRQSYLLEILCLCICICVGNCHCLCHWPTICHRYFALMVPPWEFICLSLQLARLWIWVEMLIRRQLLRVFMYLYLSGTAI